MDWQFEEGELSSIDGAYIWQYDRPASSDALVICHMQTRYKSMISAPIIRGIETEAGSILYRSRYHIVSPIDGPSLIGIFDEIPWVVWTTTEGEVLLDIQRSKSRSRSMPPEAISRFLALDTVSICGGAYGGCLSDVANTLCHLGIRVNMLAKLVY